MDGQLIGKGYSQMLFVWKSAFLITNLLITAGLTGNSLCAQSNRK